MTIASAAPPRHACASDATAAYTSRRRRRQARGAQHNTEASIPPSGRGDGGAVQRQLVAHPPLQTRRRGDDPSVVNSYYAEIIKRLAPDQDPAHVEAWMRLEHDNLDNINPIHFAREVLAAATRARQAGIEESDALARSYRLQPPSCTPDDYKVGDHILVQRDPGLPPAEAKIVAQSAHRPHVVKVIYRQSRTGAWIARTRILGHATHHHHHKA